MINAYWFYELKVFLEYFLLDIYTVPQVEYLLFECLQDFTGGDLVFSLGINSLLVDTTTTETRTRKLIMIDAFRYAGRAVGMQVGASIWKFYGWQSVFMVSFFFLVLNFLYIFFIVKENKKPSAKIDKGDIDLTGIIIIIFQL